MLLSAVSLVKITLALSGFLCALAFRKILFGRF